MKAETRKQFSAIKKLLLSRDLDQIVQGAELTAALDDPEVWEALLGDVEFERDVVRPNGRWRGDRTLCGRLRPGKIFPANKNSIYWDEAALIELVARSSHPLRNQVTHLAIGFCDQNVPPPLGVLSEFPALVQVDIQVSGPVDLGPLAESTSIATVRISDFLGGASAPTTVPALPSLRELHVAGRSLDIDPMPNLEDLQVRYLRKGSATASAPLASVRHATVDSADGSMRWLFNACPNLETLGFDRYPFVRESEFPAGLRIRGGELEIRSETLGNINELVGLEHVSLLRRTTDFDLSVLRQCAELKVLDIRDSAVTDLSPLAGHPELRYVAASGTSLDTWRIPPDIEPLVSYAKKPDLEKARLRKRPKSKPAKKSKKKSHAVLEAAEWPDIERDLAGKTVEQVYAGIDAAIDLGPDAIDFLLSKVSVSRNRLRVSGPIRLPLNLHAIGPVGRLLATAGSDSTQAARLRDTERLVIEGKFKRHGSPIDLTHIAEFAKLDQLVVRNAKSITPDAAALPLRSLVVSAHQIDVQSVSTNLRRLMVGYSKLDEPSAVLASQIQELGFVGQLYPVDHHPFLAIPTLQILRQRPMFHREVQTWSEPNDELEFPLVDIPGPDCAGLTDKSWDKA